MFKKKIKIHDLEKELHWLRGYTDQLEDAIKEMQAIINESTGVIGYHPKDTPLRHAIAKWDKLLDSSAFQFAEKDMRDKKDFEQLRDRDDAITRGEKELYIKTYKNMPCCIQYTPVYGGTKYVREESNDKI